MSKLITHIKRLALTLCLATPIVSWATPTATAVWRSNLGQSYSIYAVTQRDAALSEGKLTVSSTWGENAPYFDMEGLGSGTVSVLVKYSGLDIAQVYESDSQSVGVAFASVIDSDNNVVGACVQKVNGVADNTVRAYFCGASSTSATPKEIGDMTAVGGEGYLLFSYKHDTGSRTYMGTSIDSLAGGQDTNGHWSNRTVKKLVLGGDESGKAFNGAGFTIEEVAIFVGSYLSNEDVADYVFPTVTVDTTATMTMTELNTKVAAFGENTFNYFSASPVVSYDVAPSDATTTYLRSALWNGTVFIKDQNIVNLNPTIYGNPNSTLKLSGVSGHWGAAVYEKTATPAIELEDSETEGREYGYYASNGYSFYSQGAYYYVHTPELKGSGTYKANATGNGALFVADKFDNFTGKLNLEGKTVWLGTGAPTKSADTWNNQVNFPGTVRLGSTIPSNYSTWTVPNGYHGTVVQTTAANATETAFLTASAWKGTCKIAWNPGNSALDIVNYGNANSVIEIATNFGVYPTQNGGSDGAEVAAEVKIAENVTWTVSNGWTAESYRTTFAKLSGAGNLTVNGGSGGVGDPIPYTITRLEGFTGTIAGTRGKFTIGTIVAATEPTPGTKLVNCTTTNAPVLDSTEVYYNNAKVEDIELEFKAGDGIYVKAAVAYVVFQVEQGNSTVDSTNYYTTVSAAINAAKTLKKTVVLIAQPDAEDTYEIAAGETINVKKGEFTFNGIVFPTGAQYNNTTTETAGVTQYKCTTYTVTVQYPGQDPVGMTGQLIQILGGLYSGYVPGYAGTVVTVLDGSDATVGDAMPDVFTYNSEAHTYTLKTMVASYNNGYTTTYYPTLAYAVENVPTEGTIVLLTNLTLDARVEPAKSMTIDLGGKTVTTTATCGNGSAFDVKSGTVTIQNGTIVGVEQLEVDEKGNEKKETDAITARSGADVTLVGLTVTVKSQNGSCAYAFAGGKITIKSGVYSNTTTVPYQYKNTWTGMAVNQDTTITTQLVFVEGGTFSQVDPKLGDDNGQMTSFCAEGYTTKEVEGGWEVVEVQEVPVTPGAQTEPVATEEAAQAEAAKVVPSVPTAVAAVLSDDQETAYKALFEAKVVQVTVDQATKYAVEVVLKDSVAADIQTAVDAEADDLAKAAVAAAADAVNGGEATVTTKPGLYYVVEAGTELDGIEPASCTLATSESTKLTIPNKGTSGFYKIRVSVTPVDVQE